MYCQTCGVEGKVWSVRRLGLRAVCKPCGDKAIAENPETPRERRNRKARISRRIREQTMRDLGLTKTPYGWE